MIRRYPERKPIYSDVSTKAGGVNGDYVLIEDSADGYSMKKVQIGNLPGAEGVGLPSVPTIGNFSVTNLYVDAITGKLIIEYDDTPAV